MRVLDIGCGPGSLAREACSLQPAVRVTGLDPDRDMLRHAQSQTAGGACWATGLAEALPIPDDTMDRITMTLMLHHLTRPQKERALAEAVRVLRPGGRLLVIDWTAPSGVAAVGFLVVRAVDGFEQTADHADGRLAGLLLAAGLKELKTSRVRNLWLGTIAHFHGAKPAPAVLGSPTAEAPQCSSAR